ncbi:MAG: HAMP domain-containing sensor histidine kinase [Candidatus Eisenbacteria bacterium]|nr:HAMP domain-containing sensor histidine kinase [Candidatus Eisenbacteria bacterium]
MAESLHRLVQRALEPRRALVRMPGSQGEDGAGAGDRDLWPPEQAEALTDGLPTRTIRTIYAASESTGTPEEECADYPGWLRRRGVVLAVPVLIDSSDPGWILLGEKRSERRYIDEDLRLLRDAARAAGGAVDRILLIQRAAAEAAAARRLDELTRLKDDFLGRVAHDLRTPLTAIDWSLRNLQDGLAGPLAPRQSDYLRSIRAATDQLGRLVSNLVELTRLDSPAVEHLIEALSLREIVCDALAMLAPVAAERTVRLELRATTPLPPVRADRRCLSGAVMNLIDNAVRYSPDGETVEVSIERVAGGSQTLTVRDHGPGVAPEDRETIFERYGTGRRSPSDRRRAGLGLGLYVARCGIEASGGSIAVDDHPEGGARFVFTLQDWREVSDGDDPDRR